MLLLTCILAASSVIGPPDKLQVVNGTAAQVKYQGRDAVTLVPLPGHELADEDMMAVIPGTDFQDGTIELDVAGSPREGGGPGAKGFVGLAFRVQKDAKAFELFYIRPVNGRVEDQAMRNHSTQYMSTPDYGWKRLRAENPWVYESYVDLEIGKWTHLKIELAGNKARFFVNGASQPALIVNDLKRGKSRGALALWAHNTTVGHFSDLKITR